jgi:hypothetical protein
LQIIFFEEMDDDNDDDFRPAPVFALADGGRRLLDTILAWERDPDRAKKIVWRGLDDDSDSNSDSSDQEDTRSRDNLDDDDAVEEDEDEEGNEPSQYLGINIGDDFVVDNLADASVAEQASASAPQIAAPPAPAPQVIVVAGVSLPCAIPSDFEPERDPDLNCIVCAERRCTIALVPCGHMSTCLHCLYNVFKTASDGGKPALCPTCRARVTQVIRLYRN